MSVLRLNRLIECIVLLSKYTKATKHFTQSIEPSQIGITSVMKQSLQRFETVDSSCT